MASTTSIANMALSHLGSGKEIANLDSERSQEAEACRRFYDTALEATLRDYPWPFATKIATLGLVEEDPNEEWAYSYRYPSDALKIRRILSGNRNDNRQSRIPMKISWDDDGQLLFCDVEDAEVEYTFLNEDTGHYPPDFVLALSWRLSFYIAPRVTGGDPFKLQERMYVLYTAEMTMAKANAVNEQQDEEPAESEFIRARD